MSERNNIDRLFQEKFKDFEVTPPDMVWENIQSRMNKKEKKTNLLPFWLRLCSFAAVFLIGFSVATTFIAGPFGLKEILIEGEKANSSPNEEAATEKNTQQSTDASEVSLEKTSGSTLGSVVSNDAANISKKNNPSPDGKTTTSKTSDKVAIGERDASKNQTSVIYKSKEVQNPVADRAAGDKTTVASRTTTSNELTVAPLSGNIEPTTASTTKTQVKDTAASNGNGTEVSIAENLSETKTADSAAELLKDSELDTHIWENNQSKVAYETGHHYVSTKSNDATETVLKNENDSKGLAVATTSVATSKGSPENKSIEKGVLIATDSLATSSEKTAEKAEEEKPADEKEKKEKKEKGSRWIVSSSFSPVYMNLNGSGSALDSKFAENSKTYQTSVSYGVGVKYALNDKWAIRTGAHMLNFNYNTNDLTFYYSSNGAGLEHVNENGTGSGIVIENPNPKGMAYNDDGVVTTRYTGNINHRINYIEVPLEASYKIVNKKFGIDVIGGVSSLFLSDNRVSIVSAESTTNVGEANNLNKVHFSTNVGLGLRYNFMKTLQANVEPMFKYQINTYSGDANNFKPYFFGVYTGISYRF